MDGGNLTATERWEVEIDAIIEGTTTSTLRALGSFREAFDVATASTGQPQVEVRAFHVALQNVVRRWIPQRASKPNATALMLDAIAAYTPVGGLEKLLWLIDQYGHDDHVVPHPIEPRRNVDLHLRALHAAAAYFRYAPDTVTPSFVHYVVTLDRHLDLEQYRPHAVERLLHLHAVRLEDDSVGKTLDDHPTALPELMRAAAALQPAARAARAMTQLYAECRTRALLDAYTSAVVALGGLVTPRQAGPDGWRIVVQVQGRDLKLGFVPEEEAHAYELAPKLLKDEIRNARRVPRNHGGLRAVHVVPDGDSE